MAVKQNFYTLNKPVRPLPTATASAALRAEIGGENGVRLCLPSPRVKSIKCRRGADEDAGNTTPQSEWHCDVV